ncbi:MAG: FHA domain-containing protein, partial [Microcoleus sp. T3-bin5]|nr:FHA domain-containing protein [Microcoleus sp. T3-bin5]
NFGANGTYVDDRPIAQVSVVDGMTIRLGNSGPKIRIRVGATNQPGKITRPPQRELRQKDEVLKDRSTAGPRGVGIIEDDEQGGLTQIDLD